MAKRGFTCLCCGRLYRVDKEAYEAIRENPVCENCRQETSVTTQTKETGEFAWSEFGYVVQKSIEALTSIKRAADEKHEDTRQLSDYHTLEDAPINPWQGKQRTSDWPGSPVGDILMTTAQLVSNVKATAATENLSWQHIGCLGEVYGRHKEALTRYNDCVGLYMHKINGQIMYIGRAVEYNNGGFRKRLSDYCRDSDSARKHPSGQKIYANRYRIQTYVMVVGKNREAAERTKLLEKQYIARYNPPWNDKLKEQ